MSWRRRSFESSDKPSVQLEPERSELATPLSRLKPFTFQRLPISEGQTPTTVMRVHYSPCLEAAR